MLFTHLKLKRAIFIIIFWLVSFLFASNKIDSLQITLLDKIGKEKIEPLSSLASEYFKIGNYDEALDIQQEIRDLSRKYNDQPALAYSLSEIGYIYKSKADYDKAITYFQQAINLYESLLDKSNQALILNRIGSVFREIGDSDKALDYYQKSLNLRKELNDKRGMASSYNNIGIIYQNNREYDKALELYFKALAINEELGNQHWKSINLNNIGFVYLMQKKFQSALKYMKQSLEIKLKRNDTRGVLHTYGNIASVYWEIGDVEKTKEYLKKSLSLAKEIGSKNHILKCYYDLTELYRTQQDYKSAFEYQDKYIALKDSIFDQEKIETITEIQTKYETEKKDQEISNLTRHSQMQKKIRNLLIIIILLILILVLVLVQLYRRNLRTNRILEDQKQKIQTSKNQIEDMNKNLEKRVEEEVAIRREQEQKALEQSRLAALGELAAGIAHELNQPLHSISFAIDNMAMAVNENDADEAYLKKKIKKLADDADRMKRIIDHIRTFSRNQLDAESKPFSINQSIINAVNMIKEQYANHRIYLQLELDNNLPDIMGNLYRFEQVVLILLTNGKDAVEEKSTHTSDFRKQLTIKTYQNVEKILMTFEDNGNGIFEDNISKIFNPFFTTKKPGQGTGLGLSIAFGIITEMGGSIEVETKTGVGSKFIVNLPQI